MEYPKAECRWGLRGIAPTVATVEPAYDRRNCFLAEPLHVRGTADRTSTGMGEVTIQAGAEWTPVPSSGRIVPEVMTVVMANGRSIWYLG